MGVRLVIDEVEVGENSSGDVGACISHLDSTTVFFLHSRLCSCLSDIGGVHGRLPHDTKAVHYWWAATPSPYTCEDFMSRFAYPS